MRAARCAAAASQAPPVLREPGVDNRLERAELGFPLLLRPHARASMSRYLRTVGSETPSSLAIRATLSPSSQAPLDR